MHGLILGMTESGKTTCAKELIKQFKSRGIITMVLDPLKNAPHEWGADFITDDKNEFLKVYWDSKSCAAFFDESGDYCGQHDKDFVQTATRGRHFGHANYYLAQRGTLLSRTVRDQCGRIFLFNSSLSDSKTHADEWNCPALINAPKLQKGECFTKTRFGDVTKINLF